MCIKQMSLKRKVTWKAGKTTSGKYVSFIVRYHSILNYILGMIKLEQCNVHLMQCAWFVGCECITSNFTATLTRFPLNITAVQHMESTYFVYVVTRLAWLQQSLVNKNLRKNVLIK
jgi:hypothetical protein